MWPSPKRKARSRGTTLVELMVALAVVAVLSSAVAVMLAGAGKTYQWVNTQADAMSDVENAFRRILHNVRTASALTAPSSGVLTNTLTVQTQADPSYGNAPATVTYAIVDGNLVETDTRDESSAILVRGVSAFTVQRTGTAPTQVAITITSGSTPPVTRTALITCRNL
jgi:prepilin-type N-terminal cleavage/methylation domain-containing protein